MKRHEIRPAIRREMRYYHDHSDRRIARKLGVSHVTVAKVRSENPAWSDWKRMGEDSLMRRCPEQKTPGKHVLDSLKAFSTALNAFIGHCSRRPEDREINAAKTRLLREWAKVNSQMIDKLMT